MTKEFLEKANRMCSNIAYWQDQIDYLEKVLRGGWTNYHVTFHDEGSPKSPMVERLNSDLNKEVLRPFAKQCLEIAEKELEKAKKAFEEL